VVSHECNAALAQRSLHINKIADDTGAFRAAIDVVTEKDKTGRLLAGIVPTARDQTAQLLERAMDVADSEGKRHDATKASAK
jgi:hypothetical protein